MSKISPFLWFNKDAGEAAEFYASVFKGSRIKKRTIVENTPSGTIEVINMELFGQEFTLMGASSQFRFTEAVSFVVNCKNQEEVDYYWEKLSADPNAGECGWLKDKYGLSWQIIPKALNDMTGSPDREKANRAVQAMLTMKKIDIKAIEEAFEGR